MNPNNVFERLASNQNINNDAPNIELAKEITINKQRRAILVLVDHLRNSSSKIQSDCIKVLYEIGYQDPTLIADQCSTFVELLSNKNNRLKWGAMIALSTISELKSDEIFAHKDEVIHAINKGSVITVDAGIKTLANVAASNPLFRKSLLPFLLDHLANCRPKDIPQHSEFIQKAVNKSEKQGFLSILNKRLGLLNKNQTVRVQKVIKNITSI